MSLALRDLHACFEGVIPSIVATAAADGAPNISYLSHVVMVDAEHVALSNQFFAKTAANIRANPQATLLLVDGRNGAQFLLDLAWVRSLDEGPLFERVSTQLRASSAQVGMSGVMRLKAVDIFRVGAIATVPSPVVPAETISAPPPDLPAIARITRTIAEQTDAESVIGAMLAGLREGLGFEQAIVLLNDDARSLLTTVASVGYGRSGAGSEVPHGEGLIGAAAATKRPIKVSDMSRIRRLGAAIEASSAEENRTRSIALPGLSDAMSQIALPLVAQDVLRGVLFVESRERLAFGEAQESALEMLALQGASALALSESWAGTGDARRAGPSPPPAEPAGRPVQVLHHRFDDSVFIDNAYVIKGVAARLLVFMLEAYLAEGRREFTNREIRLSEAVRLPDIKDNLETRLLLLRRRLDEKALAVRLLHVGRGRVRLDVDGTPVITSTT